MDTNNLKVKVSLITLYFYPDKASTANLLTDLAVGLKEMGCEVKVYTGRPSYWGDKSRVRRRELYKGVDVHRVLNTQFDTRKKIGMISNGITFFTLMFFKLILTEKDRIFLIVTNPPFLPYLGYILKKLGGIDYIIIVHDIHPDIAIKIGYMHDGIIAKIWSRTYSLVYDNANKIIVLGQCMAEVIKEKLYDKSFSKIKIIQNWEDENFIKPLNKTENWFSKKHNLLDKFIILYSGNMSQHHDLESILAAANNFKNAGVKFVFIGDGIQKKKLCKIAYDLNLDNVEFFPFQPRENVPYTMTCGDAIIVSQEKGTEGLCVSCKLYTAMAAGRPILAIVGKESEIARVVEEYNCGIVIDNADSAGIVNAVSVLQNDKKLCAQMGENARKAFETEFTKSIAVEKYYNEIINLYNEEKRRDMVPKELCLLSK